MFRTILSVAQRVLAGFGGLFLLAIIIAMVVRGCGSSATTSSTQVASEEKKTEPTVSHIAHKAKIVAENLHQSGVEKASVTAHKPESAVFADRIKKEKNDTLVAEAKAHVESLEKLAREAEQNVRTESVAFGYNSYTTRTANQKAKVAREMADEARAEYERLLCR